MTASLSSVAIAPSADGGGKQQGIIIIIIRCASRPPQHPLARIFSGRARMCSVALAAANGGLAAARCATIGRPAEPTLTFVCAYGSAPVSQSDLDARRALACVFRYGKAAVAGGCGGQGVASRLDVRADQCAVRCACGAIAWSPGRCGDALMLRGHCVCDRARRFSIDWNGRNHSPAAPVRQYDSRFRQRYDSVPTVFRQCPTAFLLRPCASAFRQSSDRVPIAFRQLFRQLFRRLVLEEQYSTPLLQ